MRLVTNHDVSNVSLDEKSHTFLGTASLGSQVQKLHILARPRSILFLDNISTVYDINLQNVVIKPWRNRRHFHNCTLTYMRYFIMKYLNKMPFNHDLEMLLIASILQANFGWIYYFSKFAVLKNRNSIQNGMAISLRAWMIILILLKYFNMLNLIKVVLIIPFLCPHFQFCHHP